MAVEYNEHPSLFKKGKKLAQGRGLSKMIDKAYKNNWSKDNTIVERNEFKGESFSEIENTGWKIYERQRIQDGKPASHYHQTAIAKDINNVKKRRS